MAMANSSLRNHRRHIDRRLQFRLRIYFAIAAVLIIILLYNFFRGALRLDFGLGALAIGIIVGIASSRMYHISWDKDANRVVSRLDAIGIGILVLYILSEVFREKIISALTHGVEVGAISLAVLAGILFGRVLGTRGKIVKVLREEKIFG